MGIKFEIQAMICLSRKKERERTKPESALLIFYRTLIYFVPKIRSPASPRPGQM